MTTPTAYEQSIIDSMAHMTIAEIEYWVDRLTKERSVPLYPLLVSSYVYQETGDSLWRYSCELERRLRLQIAENDAAIADGLAEMGDRAANFRALADQLDGVHHQIAAE